MNAGAAATNVARLRAAAEAATLRIGHVSAAPGSDRGERQTVHQPVRTPRVRVAIELELVRENRVRSVTAFARRGPSPLFMAQYLGQKTAQDAGDAMPRAQAAAHYPSLGIEQDILLPGEDAVLVTDVPRVDLYV